MGEPGHKKYTMRVTIVPVKARKPYYAVWIYVEGKRVAGLKKVLNPDLVTKWFLYNQVLLSEGYARVVKTQRGTVKILFSRGVERHFKLFLFHIYSVLNTRSAGRADCYARCWSSVDATSPVVDVLWELAGRVHVKKLSRMLRGFCSCK